MGRVRARRLPRLSGVKATADKRAGLPTWRAAALEPPLIRVEFPRGRQRRVKPRAKLIQIVDPNQNRQMHDNIILLRFCAGITIAGEW
jgi:hypothetical protein